MEFVIWTCRGVHIISAVVWLGGLIYYNAVLAPVVKHEGLHRHNAMIVVQERFLGFIWTTLWPLLVTGTILLVLSPRLADATWTSTWTLAILVKVVMFVSMGFFTWQLKQVIHQLRNTATGSDDDFEGWYLAAVKLVRRSIVAGIIAVLAASAIDLV